MNKYDEAIKKALPEMSIVSVYEYPSCYVYSMIADRLKDKIDGTPMRKALDSTYSIDKKTMYVSPFSPFNMPKNEYKKGKKIR